MSERDQLLGHYADRLQVNRDLERRLVSYQADKGSPFFRWFKYREGFTSHLVEYLLGEIHPNPGRLLDPFAGSGAALFAARKMGWSTLGIEVLPVGIHAMEARIAAECVNPTLFAETVTILGHEDFASRYDERYALSHIAITQGAFPAKTEREIVGYIAYCNESISDSNVRTLALFAAFCILEDISFTRKDGQYLRWDWRSGRSVGKKQFDKGRVLDFRSAVAMKLNDMAHDLLFGRFFEGGRDVDGLPQPKMLYGSCLDILPTLADRSVDTVLTSPPYCNRYDYTRTYALELMYLGCTHEDVIRLRQAMLSCTVENRTKRDEMRLFYANRGQTEQFEKVERVFEDNGALHEILAILDQQRDAGMLNNPHIARMVRNYFYEMCFVIYEMARILAKDGHVIMVNDNVQYVGEEVPVDLILSRMAEAFGLSVEVIWALPRGKGNSSQQMGNHGRSELRKCVYVWKRSKDS